MLPMLAGWQPCTWTRGPASTRRSPGLRHPMARPSPRAWSCRSARGCASITSTGARHSARTPPRTADATTAGTSRPRRQPRTALLLIPGISQTGWSWAPVARRLCHSTRVLAIDLRGHGLSEVPRDGYELESLAWDGLTVLAANGFGVEVGGPPAVVAGHGFGAQVAATMGALQPASVAGVALVDGGWEDVGEATRLSSAEFLAGLAEPPEVLRTMDAFLADRRGFDPRQLGRRPGAGRPRPGRPEGGRPRGHGQPPGRGARPGRCDVLVSAGDGPRRDRPARCWCASPSPARLTTTRPRSAPRPGRCAARTPHGGSRRPTAWSASRVGPQPDALSPRPAGGRAAGAGAGRPGREVGWAGERHPRPPIIALVVVLFIRGPKMLPKLGEALGRSMKDTREELDRKSVEDDTSASRRSRPPDQGSCPHERSAAARPQARRRDGARHRREPLSVAAIEGSGSQLRETPATDGPVEAAVREILLEIGEDPTARACAAHPGASTGCTRSSPPATTWTPSGCSTAPSSMSTTPRWWWSRTSPSIRCASTTCCRSSAPRRSPTSPTGGSSGCPRSRASSRCTHAGSRSRSG